MIVNINILHIGVLAMLLTRVQAELFTALVEVEPLLETHKRIIEDLEDYIKKEENRLGVLKKHLNVYKKEHKAAMEDIPNYLGNPINAFTLIKRLTTDLDHIEQRINVGTEYIKNVTINHQDAHYPTLEDLTGAAQALTRLQETYKLNVRDLSEGILNGVQYSTSMSAGDCFELGRALYNQKDYKNCLAWMLETYRKYKEEDQIYPFDEVEIMEYIGYSYYLLGETKIALEWTKRLLALDPNHARALGNVPHYEKTIAQDEEKKRRERRGDTGDINEPVEEKPRYLKDRQSYEALCRGEMDIPSEIAKRLTCKYTTDTHAVLRIAPVKTEYLYLEPDVVLFHDVMSDKEIAQIKELAKPRLKRAVVYDPVSGELVIAQYRISKSGWLRDADAAVVAAVSRRVAALTGLSVASAEELQVVNYGIGGHYEPHYDFSRKAEKAFAAEGNRIATVLFYMSEVAQGGATVFTELGLSVFPVKNAAVFWLNLHASGEGDFATRHAACPVLRGSKWVSNKWIHQGGQEFIKPCSLEYQEEGFVRQVLRPIAKTSR